MKAIALLLCLGLVAPAFANNVPSQDDIMPVMSEVDGEALPVVAKKDGDYFPVFLKRGGQPYFADASGKTHFVYNNKTQKGFDVFVEKEGDFVAIKAEAKNTAGELKFASGDESVTQPVTFGYRRYYRVRYRSYNNGWNNCPRYYGGYYNYRANYSYNYNYNYNYSYRYNNYGYNNYSTYYRTTYYRPYYGYGCVIY